MLQLCCNEHAWQNAATDHKVHRTGVPSSLQVVQITHPNIATQEENFIIMSVLPGMGQHGNSEQPGMYKAVPQAVPNQWGCVAAEHHCDFVTMKTVTYAT